MNIQKENPLVYFRIKTEWVNTNDVGALEKTKTEELVFCSCYTDAEATAYKIAENQNRFQYGEIGVEVIKTKIADVQFNDVLDCETATINGMIGTFCSDSEKNGSGLYSVKVLVFEDNEVSGKTKTTTENVYVPARSNAEAIERVNNIYQDSMCEYVIRDVKFDNAKAIYWPTDTYQAKVKEYDNK